MWELPPPMQPLTVWGTLQAKGSLGAAFRLRCLGADDQHGTEDGEA